MHILALANSTPHSKRSAAHYLNEPWCQSRGEDEVVEGSRVSKEGRRDWVGVGAKCIRGQIHSGLFAVSCSEAA